MGFCSIVHNNTCCELVAIATATMSHPTVSVMCQEMGVLVYHTDLAKMLPDVGIDGEVCIQRALMLTNVDLGC